MASTPARGGVGDTLIVAPGMLTQYGEGCGHRQAALPGEHALGLFDDHSTVPGSLQLRGDLPRVKDRALAQDRHRRHLDERLGDCPVGLTQTHGLADERVHCAESLLP